MDEPIRPLFVVDPPEPGGLFSNGQIGDRTGLSVTRLKEFQTKRLVHVREIRNTGATAWNMSARGDAAAFVVLSELRDTIGANLETLRAASLALYGWRVPEQESKPWYPLLHALYDAANEPRKFWTLRLRFIEHTQTGQRRIVGYCYSEADPPRLNYKPEELEVPIGDFHLILNHALIKLVGAFRRHAGQRLDA